MREREYEHLEGNQLQAYLYARLSPAEQSRVDEHLRGCPTCRSGLEFSYRFLRRRCPRPEELIEYAEFTYAGGTLPLRLGAALKRHLTGCRFCEEDVKAYHEALHEGVFAPEPMHQPAGADNVRPPDRGVVQPPIQFAAASRDRLERWLSPVWQPFQLDTAAAPSAREQVFALDEGEIRVTCEWRAAYRDQPAVLRIAWHADITRSGEFWVRFTRADDLAVLLAEVPLGRALAGEEVFSAPALGFDPTQDPWALTLVLKDPDA
ncbi:MAG: zf-HC2 domain-containing protein [Nitrospinae bacterium]|nr:zf-HC2 domain-containing protein [Nitrospinota bacterium]